MNLHLLNILFLSFQIPASVISSRQIYIVASNSKVPANQDYTIQQQQNQIGQITQQQFITQATPNDTLTVSNSNVVAQQSQPRQHPKKRKFNPSELEEMECTSSNLVKNGNEMIYTISTPQMIVTRAPPFNTDHEYDEVKEHKTVRIQALAPPAPVHHQTQSQQQQQQHHEHQTVLATKKMYTASTHGGVISNSFVYSSYNSKLPKSSSPLVTQVAHNSTSNINLSNEPHEFINLNDWCDYRVLAKHKKTYVSGIICRSDVPNAVVVKFQGGGATEVLQNYYDIFGSGKYDIINDASPSAADVS